MRCVLVGECMVELAPSGVPGHYAQGFAGDTFNTAWYLARLRPDWDVRYYTAIGTDPLSDRFVAFAQDAGIATDGIQRIAGRTLGLYLIHVDGGERTFSYWRGQSAARSLADESAPLDAALAGADIVAFSGITLAILPDAARAQLLTSVAAARARGATVAFDPNLRPALWPDPQAMRDAIMAGAAVADIVLPSLDEEMLHFGDADAEQTCARYAAAGAQTVIVKNGEGPVRFLRHGGSGEVELPHVVAPLDTTAAGDSFNAACLSAIAAEAPPAEAIAAGATLAARVVQSRGALVAV